jgi:hypothetical protein
MPQEKFTHGEAVELHTTKDNVAMETMKILSLLNKCRI